jgi:DNA-directed RNA polymerases I, II, and III subunit RPABC1
MLDQNLYRVYKTINSMLSKRLYNIDPNKIMSYDLFKNLDSRADITIKTHKISDPHEKINVYFPEDDKVGVKPIRNYIKEMLEEKTYRTILVVKEGITSFANNEVQNIIRGEYGDFVSKSDKDSDKGPQDSGGSNRDLSLSKNEIIIETFTYSELRFDITEHCLVPKHELISDLEKKQLLSRYNIKESQLPKIAYNEAVVKYYGLQKSDIVKITRSSETAGIYTMYRIVV